MADRAGVTSGEGAAHFDLSVLPPGDRNKLLLAVIVPRPIAWVVTRSAEGELNAAPFSFFNMMGSDPPIVAIGIGNRASGEPKDSAANIAETGELVVHIVDESLAAQMNITGAVVPRGVNELERAGLATIPSRSLATPRIADAAVSMECRHERTIGIRRTRIVLAEVLHLHIREDLVDLERLYVRTPDLHAIGRMHGSGWYARTRELFEMPRI